MGITIEKLKTLIDYDLLLTSLGFKIYYSNQDEIRAACAIHGGDNKTAFCLKKSSGRFYCFTKKCEIDPSGEVNNDTISLVMRVNNSSFLDAVNYIANMMNVVVDLSSGGSIEDDKKVNIVKDREKFIKGFSKQAHLPEIDNILLAESIKNGATYFRSIGVSDEVIRCFELGSLVDDAGVDRGTIPIRDDLGRFVGLSGRRTDGNQEPRYKLMKDFKKSKVLYNLYNAKKVKDDYKGKLVIVEGFKALWYVYDCGFRNVCAVMGAKISQDQINLLVKYNISDCILMLDGDEAGRIGMDRSLAIMSNKVNTIPLYLPEGRSPDDINKTELTDLITTFVFA